MKALAHQGDALGHHIHLHTYDLLNPSDLDLTDIEYCITYAGWLPPDNSEPEKTMLVNCTGIQFFLDKLINVNRLILEHVVITGSIAGVRVRPSNEAYGKAKHCLHQYVHNLQEKYGAKITFTLVIPGYVQTKMIAGHNTPALLTVSTQKMARKYIDYLESKPKLAYSQPAWGLIAIVIKMIPGFILKRMKF
ncbi:MAG: SDR family oxidoreductase [Chitinophagaceae bacterium]